MTTKTTRRWWPSWKRQTERPERLERRNPSGFGHECVEAIYQILFPDILEDGGLDTATKMQTSNCFENGAFVFEDNDQSLFKILIGDNGTGTRTDNEYGKLEGRKTTRFSSRKTLTHLIPAFLKKQGSKSVVVVNDSSTTKVQGEQETDWEATWKVLESNTPDLRILHH